MTDSSGPYRADSAQHQIDFWKLRSAMLEDQLKKQVIAQEKLEKALRLETLAKNAALARADAAEKKPVSSGVSK